MSKTGRVISPVIVGIIPVIIIIVILVLLVKVILPIIVAIIIIIIIVGVASWAYKKIKMVKAYIYPRKRIAKSVASTRHLTYGLGVLPPQASASTKLIFFTLKHIIGLDFEVKWQNYFYKRRLIILKNNGLLNLIS
ncbi:MAG TPA: hypothetical protein VF884_12605 [Nitrososphaeraceae archaeon]